MGKKIIACLLAVFMLCGSVSALAAPPKLESPSACLMDAETGQILYELDAQTERPMASITKTMTALLIMENGDLSASTVATAEAINSVELDSTRVGFEPNEQLTVDELMYCMLVYSANDAANILACYLDGNVQAFGHIDYLQLSFMVSQSTLEVLGKLKKASNTILDLCI